jgi:hypothetical protein
MMMSPLEAGHIIISVDYASGSAAGALFCRQAKAVIQTADH